MLSLFRGFSLATQLPAYSLTLSWYCYHRLGGAIGGGGVILNDRCPGDHYYFELWVAQLLNSLSRLSATVPLYDMSLVSTRRTKQRDSCMMSFKNQEEIKNSPQKTQSLHGDSSSNGENFTWRGPLDPGEDPVTLKWQSPLFTFFILGFMWIIPKVRPSLSFSRA